MPLTAKERARRYRQKDRTPSPRAAHGHAVRELAFFYNLLRTNGKRGPDRRPMPRSTFYRRRKLALDLSTMYGDPMAWQRLIGAGQRDEAIAVFKQYADFLLAGEFDLLRARLEASELGLSEHLGEHPVAEVNRIDAEVKAAGLI